MFDLVLLLGLFGSLTFFIPSRIDGDELWGFYFLMLVTVCSFFYKKRRDIPLKGLGLIMVWSLVTYALNFKAPLVLRMGLVNFFVGVIALKTITECTSLRPMKLGRLLIPVVILEISLLLLQGMKLEPFYQRVYAEPAGSFLVPWAMGCAAVLMTPFVCAVHPAFFILLIPLLVLSKSWSCLLVGMALFAGTFWKCARRKVLPILIVVLTLSGIYLAFLGHHISFVRGLVWVHSLKYLHNPLTGNGFGSWAHEAFLYPNGGDQYHWQWAHNEFFQQFFEQGAVGLILVLSWLFLLWIKTTSLELKLAILGLGACSFFHPVLHWSKLTYLVIVILALAVKDAYSQRTQYEME